MNAQPRNLHQRLHDAMGEVDYVQKERKNGMNYTIVSHDAVTAKVRPVLHRCGVIYYPVEMQHRQDGNRCEVALKVRFVNVDEPTDFIDVPGLGYGVDPSDKGPGKAVSYAVKYCLLKTLGLETGDDPDEDDASMHVPAARPEVRQEKPPQRQAPAPEEARQAPRPDIPAIQLPAHPGLIPYPADIEKTHGKDTAFKAWCVAYSRAQTESRFEVDRATWERECYPVLVNLDMYNSEWRKRVDRTAALAKNRLSETMLAAG